MRTKLILLLAVFILSLHFASACTPKYSCPSWGECVDGIQTRSCKEIACGLEDTVERQLCADSSAQCSVKYSCSEWSLCSYLDKTQDILNSNIRFKGYQERACVDLNQCVEGFAEQKSCEDTFDVNFVEVEQCGSTFLVALDANSQKGVSQISIDSWRSQRLDITFIQSNFSYCPTCYNGFQDSTEEGIDCGGNCKACQEETGPSEQIILIASTWLLSIVIFGGFVASSIFNRSVRVRYLIYHAYQALERGDKVTLKRDIDKLRQHYKRMNDKQKDLFRKDLDKLYRRI